MNNLQIRITIVVKYIQGKACPENTTKERIAYFKMIGHEPRFFPRPPTLSNHSNDLAFQMKRFADVNNQFRFDTNRNTLPNDRQLFDPMAKYYQDQNMMKNLMKTPIRNNNMRGHMNYFPYPTLPFVGMYNRQMGGTTDFTGFSTQDTRSLIRPNMEWQLDQVGEYCAEILNRDKHYWTDEETALMLELYEENRNYFNDSKTKKTKVWSVIASIINKRFNTSVNSEQCSQKYRNLKAEFLKVVDPNSVDGGAKKFGRHFVQMKRLIDAEEKHSKNNHQSPSPLKGNSPNTASNSTNKSSGLTSTFSGKQQRQAVQTTSNENFSSINIPANINDKIIFKTPELNPPNLRGLEQNPQLGDTASLITSHSNEMTSTTLAIISPSNSSLTTISPTSSNGSSTNSPTSCSSSDLVTDENEASLPINERARTTLTYVEELDEIFKEYFQSRDKTYENIEETKKENVVCLKRCLNVFQKMVGDNVFA